jgi:hypothetical protein
MFLACIGRDCRERKRQSSLHLRILLSTVELVLVLVGELVLLELVLDQL